MASLWTYVPVSSNTQLPNAGKFGLWFMTDPHDKGTLWIIDRKAEDGTQDQLPSTKVIISDKC